MHIFMSIIFIDMYVHTYIIYASVCMCAYVYLHKYGYLCLQYLYVCIWPYLYTHPEIYTHTLIYVHYRICAAYDYKSTYTCRQPTGIYRYMYIVEYVLHTIHIRLLSPLSLFLYIYVLIFFTRFHNSCRKPFYFLMCTSLPLQMNRVGSWANHY